MKTKLDVGKMKTAPIDLKNLSDLVSKEVIENTNFFEVNTKAKVNSFEKKFPNVSTLIHTDQYNTEKKIYRKKLEDVDQSHFEDHDTKKHLVFQPVLRYFTKLLITITFRH